MMSFKMVIRVKENIRRSHRENGVQGGRGLLCSVGQMEMVWLKREL